MALVQPPAQRLEPTACPMPALQTGQLRLRVRACSVCRTDLHLVDGELATPTLPRIPGHEIVGEVALTECHTVFAFTRPGDTTAQALALSLGAQCAWAGDHRLRLATRSHPLALPNDALDDLRGGHMVGAAVLQP
jgi:D-arabinose 1-dehydrogenase-like Zn-dependent alcohol dehydrogenase